MVPQNAPRNTAIMSVFVILSGMVVYMPGHYINLVVT